ncbi:MAG: hypothetical protein FWD97_08215 [Defluviitaleaceae bacterium]|nr:hypothetical protein [Defluviitaleaceae bacterium]
MKIIGYFCNGRGGHCPSHFRWRYRFGSDGIVCMSGTGNARPYHVMGLIFIHTPPCNGLDIRANVTM